MIRQTSRDAYADAINSGLITGMAEEIFALINEYQPLTASMVHDYYCKILGPKTIRSTAPRITELAALLAIKPAFTDTCPITGHPAIHWTIAPDCSNLVKPKKKLTAGEKVVILTKALEGIASQTYMGVKLECAFDAEEALRAVE